MSVDNYMDKWREYGCYEAWVESNRGVLKHEYDEYIEKNYDWVMPDTFVSFGDFCMGKWQRL